MSHVRSLILLISFANLINGNPCPWDLPNLHLWSDFSSWNNGVPPSNGDSFAISERILLDIETPSLGVITIAHGGMLIFSPNHKVLTTKIKKLFEKKKKTETSSLLRRFATFEQTTRYELVQAIFLQF